MLLIFLCIDEFLLRGRRKKILTTEAITQDFFLQVGLRVESKRL